MQKIPKPRNTRKKGDDRIGKIIITITFTHKTGWTNIQLTKEDFEDNQQILAIQQQLEAQELEK